MTVFGSCAARCATSGAMTSSFAAVVFIGGGAADWQAAARSAASRAVRFIGGALYYRRDRTPHDHRVHELPRAVSVQRRSFRAKALEENQMREVRDGFRDPQSRVR